MDLKPWGIFPCEFISRIKMAYVIGQGDEALVVRDDDEVFGMGCVASGYQDSNDADAETGGVSRIEALCGKKVAGFAYGESGHVLAFTEGGALYSWGNNDKGQLGNGSCENCWVPNLVKNISAIVINVACGVCHSLVLTDKGNVIGFGDNTNRQLGMDLSGNNYLPKCIRIGEKIAAVACGAYSSFAVTDNGQVYSWGWNGSGELGLGLSDYKNESKPCLVDALVGMVIIRVVCGNGHTLALTSSGALYAWGSNEYGQLGTGKKENSCSPVLVAASLGRIVDIAAVHYLKISAAMTQSFRVYVWGQCLSGSVCSPVPTPYSSLHDVFAYNAIPRVMWRPLQFQEPLSESINECLSRAFDNDSNSDLIIKVEDKPIYVHKAILKIRCQHFHSMLQEHWQESKKGVIEITQFSYTTYRAFLQYLYTDEINLSPENCLELLELAHSYCEMKLKHRCEEIIRQGITVENVIMLYFVAVKYDAKEIQTFCFTFFLDNITDIILSDGFAKLYEIEGLKDLLVKAAKYGAFKK